MFQLAGAARCDDGNGNCIGNGLGELNVIPVLGAVGVHAGQENFPGAELHAPLRPFESVDAGVAASAVRVDLGGRRIIKKKSVNCKNDALVSETFRPRADKIGILNGGGVDGNLVRSGIKHFAHIFNGSDSAADGQGNEDIFRGSADNVIHGIAVVAGCGDVKKDKFIRSLTVVFDRGFNRVAGIDEVHKVDAFDDASAGYVEAGDNSFCQHWFHPSFVLL